MLHRAINFFLFRALVYLPVHSYHLYSTTTITWLHRVAQRICVARVIVAVFRLSIDRRMHCMQFVTDAVL